MITAWDKGENVFLQIIALCFCSKLLRMLVQKCAQRQVTRWWCLLKGRGFTPRTRQALRVLLSSLANLLPPGCPGQTCACESHHTNRLCKITTQGWQLRGTMRPVGAEGFISFHFISEDIILSPSFCFHSFSLCPEPFCPFILHSSLSISLLSSVNVFCPTLSFFCLFF